MRTLFTYPLIHVAAAPRPTRGRATGCIGNVRHDREPKSYKVFHKECCGAVRSKSFPTGFVSNVFSCDDLESDISDDGFGGF